MGWVAVLNLTFLFLIMLSCQVLADDPLAGRPFPETRLGVGARAQAMGCAQTAYLTPTTVTAYWNPAMAAMLPDKGAVSAAFRFLSLGRQEGVIGFSTRIPPRGAVTTAVTYHGDGGIPIYNSDGELEYSDGGFTNLSIYIGFSYLLTRKLSMGLATVIRSSSISAGEDEEVSAWEVGSLFYSVYYKIKPNLSAGLHLREITSGARYEAPTYGSELNTIVADGLPINLKTGLAWKTKIAKKDAAFTIDGDWYFIPGTIKENDSPDWSEVKTVTEIHVGSECFIRPNFPVRIGYSTDQGPALGFGFHFPKNEHSGIKFDYALSREPNGSGLNHSISWTLPF